MNSIRDYKPKNYGEKRDYNKNKKKRKKEISIENKYNSTYKMKINLKNQQFYFNNNKNNRMIF